MEQTNESTASPTENVQNESMVSPTENVPNESTVSPTEKVTPRKKRKKKLSRKTSNAKRLSSNRDTETIDQTQKRLSNVRQTMSLKRAAETIDETQTRRSIDRISKSTKRAFETIDQTQKRLSNVRQTMSLKRAAETIDETQKRLSKVRQTMSLKRAAETIDETQKRLSKVRRANLSKKTPKKSHGKKNASTPASFTKSRAAFTYDATVPYDTIPEVQIGKMTVLCPFCNSLRFHHEAPSICCSNGTVKLSPKSPHKSAPPKPLLELLTGNSQKSKRFQKQIRQYNSAFQMTSFGVDKLAIPKGFMSTFKIQGQLCHRIGSFLPDTGKQSKFLQIYFIGNDTDQCNVRCGNFSGLDKGIVMEIQTMLHSENHLVKQFRTAVEQHGHKPNFKVVMNSEKRPAGTHERQYNEPTAEDVGAVIIETDNAANRDIVLHMRGGFPPLKKVDEKHIFYDALQYPLIFCRGQESYNIHFPKCAPNTAAQGKRKNVREQTNTDMAIAPKTKYVTSCDFYAYMLMTRKDSVNYLHLYRELFLQFVVDMYAKVESEKLGYIRTHQSNLRAEKYVHLQDEIRQGTALGDIGKRIILPSSFVGGPRYMHQRTQDAMTYVTKYGRPDLFVTFTCNPKWDEIQSELHRDQKAHHRPDIVARVFHQKLKVMMSLLKETSGFAASARRNSRFATVFFWHTVYMLLRLRRRGIELSEKNGARAK